MQLITRFINWVCFVFDLEVKDQVNLYHDEYRNPVTFANRLLGDKIYGFFNKPVSLTPIKRRIISFRTEVGGVHGWYEFAVTHYQAVRRFERYRYKRLYVFTVRFRGPLDGVSFSRNDSVLRGKKMWQNLKTDWKDTYHVSRHYSDDYERISMVLARAKQACDSDFTHTQIPSLSA